jgi:hypothetical protein
MDYPDAPWQMTGQLWLSLFRVREAVDELRPAGVYGVAFVDYQPDSPLTYHELLVARPLRTPEGRHVTITDIWVDSVASRDGGRALWAIPKGLCDFGVESRHTGPLARTRWSAHRDGGEMASAAFSDVSRAGVRLPFKGSTWQRRDNGESVVAQLTGSAKTLPCKGSWSFGANGPLAWLAGKRPVASFRMADFRMSFG